LPGKTRARPGKTTTLKKKEKKMRKISLSSLVHTAWNNILFLAI